MTSSAQLPWVNWSGSQQICPKRVAHPRSLAELQEIVREVSASSGQLKAVATGLSFSDILRSEGTLVEVTGLLGEPQTGALLPLEEELWAAPASEPLVRIPCGARIRQLNAALASAGLGFTNLGGYDGQTMVGAISTSTHGSGLRIPPLGDSVRSLDLVGEGGRLYRIEPSAGLTDPRAFARRYADSMTLIQSDACFWPCVVALGCMGVIYSVTMAVSPAYRLQERRRIRPWSEVARELRTLVPLYQFRNYEVLLNPYPLRGGEYDCLVTERSVAVPDAEHRPLSPDQRSAESLTFLASTQREVLRLMSSEPRLIPGMLRAGFEALETREPHVDASHIVYNVGKINTADVMGGEYFYPLSGDCHLLAVERLLALIAHNARRGMHQPTPLALRFVAGSRAPLSMARREPHCAIEIAWFTGMPRGGEALYGYEQLCLELGGRPHWGQVQELTGEPGWLRSAYPGLDEWLGAHRRFNARGVFDNHFTDRLGLSMRGSVPA